MRQKHTLWRAASLLCGAALLVLLPVSASYARSKQDQKQPPRGNVTLTQQQRDMVRASVKKAKPTTTGSGAVEKDITIGERLPSNVVVERFSDTVYRAVPPVRSYHYIARDRGIYLVDPRRRTVVGLIE